MERVAQARKEWSSQVWALTLLRRIQRKVDIYGDPHYIGQRNCRGLFIVEEFMRQWQGFYQGIYLEVDQGDRDI